MEKFVIEEYYQKYQEKMYLDVFFDFILKIYDSDEMKNEYFALLEDSDLLESLDNFINVRKVTAKQTATTYWGKLKKLYEHLDKHYGITNDLFVNGNFLPALEEAVKKRISVLNDTIDKSIATDEKYDILVNEIAIFEQKYTYEAAVTGIDKYFMDSNVTSDELRIYRYICSVCAIQMVLDYGFKNHIVRDLKLSDIDMEIGIIKRNEYSFPISLTLKRNLDKYLKIRNYILSKTGKNQEELFINYDGKPFDKRGYAANLFYILDVLYDGVETDPFARRRLLEMIEKGFNSELINKITGYSDTVYKKVCSTVNSNKEHIQKKLLDFVSEDSKHNSKLIRKGYIYCPECGKHTKAIAEELILIKKKNDTVLYLACKKCGGKND